MTVKAKPATKPSPTIPVAKKPPVTKIQAPAKPVVKTAAKEPAPVPPVTTPKAEKPSRGDKPKKTKMVRDSFTMPENEYAQLFELKKKCLKTGIHTKKSELLRAGLLCLSKLPEAALIKVIEQVEILKTGRPVDRLKRNPIILKIRGYSLPRTAGNTPPRQYTFRRS